MIRENKILKTGINNQKLRMQDHSESLQVTLSTLRGIVNKSNNSALNNKVDSIRVQNDRYPQSPSIANSCCNQENQLSPTPNPFQNNINICNISSNSDNPNTSNQFHFLPQNSYNFENATEP